MRAVLRLLVCLIFVIACGAHTDGTGPDAATSTVLPGAVSDAGLGGSTTGRPDDAGTTVGSASEAARAIAEHDPACSAIQPFYWEIGDKAQSIASGQVGGTKYDADTPMGIASASKFLFGAYVVERFKADLNMIDLRAMTMQSGYVSLMYSSCLLTRTVDACLAAGDNGTLTSSAVDHFYYNGGHFQKYASTLGLGTMTSNELAAELGKVLGSELGIDYSSPQLAAGVRIKPGDYARFLRKLLAGQLALSAHLGEHAVCTHVGPDCPTAQSSPADPHAWHYSYGHWIEDDPSIGDDGSFSSPGAFGFYPWIDAARKHYGLIARQDVSADAYIKSVACGRLIRKAYLTGQDPSSAP